MLISMFPSIHLFIYLSNLTRMTSSVVSRRPLAGRSNCVAMGARSGSHCIRSPRPFSLNRLFAPWQRGQLATSSPTEKTGSRKWTTFATERQWGSLVRLKKRAKKRLGPKGSIWQLSEFLLSAIFQPADPHGPG